MENDELSEAVKGIYAKIDRIEQAMAKLLEVEVSQNYLSREVEELKQLTREMSKELGNWRTARVVLVGLGVVAAPIFVAGVNKLLGWH